jgi:hypothetical protein
MFRKLIYIIFPNTKIINTSKPATYYCPVKRHGILHIFDILGFNKYEK